MSYTRSLCRLAAPVIASQASAMLVSVADTAMVGALGTTAIGAVAFAGNLAVPLTFFGVGVAVCVTALIGRRLGRGDLNSIALLLRHARRLGWGLVALQLLLLALLTLAVPLMGQPEEVAQLAIPYLIVIGLSLIGQQMFVSLRTVIEGLQDTLSPMLIGLGCNVLNIGLNYVLIFGLGPIPALGCLGAAVATLIARLLMWGLMEHRLRVKLRKLNIPAVPRARRHRLTRRMFFTGLPMGLQSVVECGSFAAGGIMMGWLGTAPLAAHQVVNLFPSLTYMMMGGLATAVTIKVSVSMGGGNPLQARRYTMAGLQLTLIFMGSMALVCALGRHWLPGLILTDAEALSIAGVLMLVIAAYEIFDGLQVVAIGALRGYADFQYPARVATIAFALTCLPAGYLITFTLGAGPVGIWLGFLFGLIVAAALLLHRLAPVLRSPTRN